ncbi:DEAD/DEAH box helicase [Aerophototrophica crusticola]|uniref:DEAD/DEAH box helicase n=1 Tax=Aerophototrophica crusticola TaxID=1709002 RepID=A0A858R6J3_9PROT|nr:DEAD/DEAH box helicase [Rhodospirillaceae bacterium B3]
MTVTVSFADLALPQPLLQAVEELGFTTPTPIQAQAIPAALEGRDVVASANTGTGKTAAFVLPSLARIASVPRAEGSWGPRVLVLTPTRELASQVLDNVRSLSKYHRVQTGTVLGGMPYRQQIEMLRRRADLVVATPGRLIDHLENGKVDLSAVEVLVLDEADRMLDMGFREAVEHIAAACPAERQTLLFTATLDRTAERLAATLTKDAVRVDVAGKTVVTAQVEQRWLRADGLDHKHQLLEALLRDESFQKGIVFIATKADADSVADKLSEAGHLAMPLHGDMQQRERNRVVQWLRDGRIRVVVATDVAARGIDISDISHVINFDLPRVAEDYVHRIGRTGRAGATGISCSLYTRSDRNLVRAIEQYTGMPMVQHTIPGLEPQPEQDRRGFGGKPFNKGGRGGFGGGGYGGKSFGQGGRNFGDRKPYGERRSFGDRPQGGEGFQGDRPQGGPQGGEGFQGERRSFNDRPRFQEGGFQGERKPYGERKPFGGPRQDRFQDRAPANEQGGEGRPQRPWSPDSSPQAHHKAAKDHGHPGPRGNRTDFRSGPRSEKPWHGERATGTAGGGKPLRRGKPGGF